MCCSMKSSRGKCGAGKDKPLFYGIFMYRCMMMKEYARAFSKKQAKAIMMRRIADKQGVPYGYIFGLFNNESTNYRISKVTGTESP